ncbi:hypothetical protein DFH11DRAFT_1514284 [Phellopilus nigrolimitatus]|nr:hypothetical protein DFH11DRAFT_1514284 [Phellopilus nigrolimitatus]
MARKKSKASPPFRNGWLNLSSPTQIDLHERPSTPYLEAECDDLTSRTWSTPPSPQLTSDDELDATSPLAVLDFDVPPKHIRTSSKDSLFSVAFPACPGPNQKSDRFWLEDGSVVILVERTLYDVHKSVLKSHSDFFKREIQEESGAQELAHGSRRNPIVLDVAKSEFELLLTVIYPLAYDSRFDYTTSEWLTTLIISAKLKFVSIRKAASDHLYELFTVVDRIRLGRKYSVPEWSLPGYLVFCNREEPLSLEEGMELGMEDVIKISRAREMSMKGIAWTEMEKLFT